MGPSVTFPPIDGGSILRPRHLAGQKLQGQSKTVVTQMASRGHPCWPSFAYPEVSGSELRPYGVRSAVTRRTSRTIELEPAVRRQEASKFGQDCCEQSLTAERTSRRSPFASACGTLASTCGAKPGNTVSAAAMKAAAAIAEKALIITVPCHGLGGPVASLDGLVVGASFRLSSPTPEMVSSGPGFVSSAIGGRNNPGSPGGDV